jgi:hypothetical protein
LKCNRSVHIYGNRIIPLLPGENQPLNWNWTLALPVTSALIDFIRFSAVRYSFGVCASMARFFDSRMSLMVSSMIVAALKLGGIERGGKSLNVAANLKMSSIPP